MIITFAIFQVSFSKIPKTQILNIYFAVIISYEINKNQSSSDQVMFIQIYVNKLDDKQAE